jgi:hypothetical protein
MIERDLSSYVEKEHWRNKQMKLESPFLWIPSQWLWGIWLILVGATLGMVYWLQNLGTEVDRRLPNGVLAIEMPWPSEHGEEIRAALGEEGIKAAQ